MTKLESALCSLRAKRAGEFNPVTNTYEGVRYPTTKEIAETLASPTITSFAKLRTEAAKLLE